MPDFRTFQSREGLRDHLDDLNEAGVHPVAVGVDALSQPFLITLVGPYAEGEDVFFDSPWQRELGWSNGSDRCDDCDAHAHGIEDISFPVVVVAPGADNGSEGASA